MCPLRRFAEQSVSGSPWPAAAAALVLNGQAAGHHRLLQPFARVALAAAGAARHLGRGQRAAFCQGTVPAEPVAQVNTEAVEGAREGLQPPPHQGIALPFDRWGGHGNPLVLADYP
jgi:hypothetical protein